MQNKSGNKALRILTGKPAQFTLLSVVIIFFLYKFVVDATTVRLHIIEPQSINDENGSVLINLGATWFAKVEIQAIPENIGGEIVVILKENHETEPLPSTGPEPIGVRFHKEKMTLSKGWNLVRLRDADKRMMPRKIGAVMPTRFIEIQGWKGRFQKSSIRISVAVAKEYRSDGEIVFSGGEGRSQQLNEIWRLSSHTMAATSFSGLFVDGDRERLPYEADAYINQLGWLFTTGDVAVPRRTFEYLIAHPNWPTEWQAHMIFMAWADYMYSGDLSLLKRHYERLKFLTLRDLVGSNGLISTRAVSAEMTKNLAIGYPIQDIVDWPPNQRDNHDMRDNNTVTNAFAYRGFMLMSKVASVLGKFTDEEFFDEQARGVREALNKLAVKDDGLYADGVGSDHTSAHSLFIPMAFGLVDDKKKSAFVSALHERIDRYGGGFPGSVFTAQYLLEALFEAGEDEFALRLILNNSERGWLNMLQKYGATTTHEAWDVKFKDNEDWTHAWGSAPANVFPRFLIGATPIQPGWTRWKLAPSKALRFSAEAHIPTPHGVAHVKLNRENNEAFIEVPRGTTCEFLRGNEYLILPAGSHRVPWH